MNNPSFRESPKFEDTQRAPRLESLIAICLVAGVTSLTACRIPVVCLPADASCSPVASILFDTTTVQRGNEITQGPCSSCTLFVTTNTYRVGADFTGILGADNRCFIEAVARNLSGSYKALIVDDTNRRVCQSVNCAAFGNTEHKDWVLKPNTRYVRTDSFAVHLTNSEAVISTDLFNEIAAGASYWTGIQAGFWNWRTDLTNNCAAWTDGTNNANARYGVSTWLDERSVGITALAQCDDASMRLLCVQQ